MDTDTRKVEPVAEGDAITRDLLDQADAFVLDTENHLFVWVGSGKSWILYYYAALIIFALKFCELDFEMAQNPICPTNG